MQSVLCADPTVNPLVGEVQLLTRLLEVYRWSRANFDLFLSDYFEDTDSGRLFFLHVVNRFIDQARDRLDSSAALVLKNPELSLVVDELMDLLPQSRYVVTVRDPRDQVLSELEVGERQLRQGWVNSAVENRDVAALVRAAESYLDPLLEAARGERADRFLFIRYEDLVLEPDETVRRLRQFTGLRLEEFDPKADWKRVALDWESYEEVPAMTPFYGRAIDSSRIGRFRNLLTPTEIQLIERLAATQFDRFGYVKEKSHT